MPVPVEDVPFVVPPRLVTTTRNIKCEKSESKFMRLFSKYLAKYSFPPPPAVFQGLVPMESVTYQSNQKLKQITLSFLFLHYFIHNSSFFDVRCGKPQNTPQEHQLFLLNATLSKVSDLVFIMEVYDFQKNK